MELQQPHMRMDYVREMGGVDTADQQNGSHYHDHKSYNNHWRRVFDAKLCQLLTNAFLIFRKWVHSLMSQVAAEMEREDGAMFVEDLVKAQGALEKLRKMERAVWDEMLSEILMAKCNVGSIKKGGRGKQTEDPTQPVWGSVALKSSRRCMRPECKARTRKGCTCKKYCTKKGKSGVLMCAKCFRDDKSHAAAAFAHWNGVSDRPGRKKMAWQGGS